MTDSTKPVAWIVSAVAAFCAVSFALAIPSAYFFLAYQSNKGELQSEAQAMATMLVRNGAHYKNLADIPNELLTSLVNEDLTETELAENRAVVDHLGKAMASSHEKLAYPTIQAQAEILIDGESLGSIIVSRSILPTLEESFFVALIGLSFGAGLFYILRTLPLRTLYRTLNDLTNERHKATVSLSAIGDAVLLISADGIIEYTNQAAQALTKISNANLTEHWPTFISDLNLLSTDKPELVGLKIFSHEHTGRHNIIGGITDHYGNNTALEGTLSSISQDPKKPQGWVLVLRDVTEKFRTEQQLIQLANYDSLTSLPNRYIFRERLQQAMKRAHRVERLVALLYLDIDRFKAINDSLGHSAGDDLLRQIALRLQDALRSKDTVSHYSCPTNASDSEATVSRLGGDEFTIILEDIFHVDQVTSIVQRVIGTFNKSFDLSGQDIIATTSVGITIYPFDDTDIDDMIKHADAAMYRSKCQGRNTFNFYSTNMNQRASERLILESKLRKGLENGSYEIFMQPKSALKDVKVNGYEALLRYRNEDGSIIPPNDFISILEETGMIVDVGAWVIDSVCEQIAQWERAHTPIMRVAINLSARQLAQPDFVDLVKSAIDNHGIDPRHLEFEITESLLIASQDTGVTRLHSLRTLGIHISIDDFGTGYSSLAYLKHLPIDTLKIDQSFVHDITSDEDSASIVRAIIHLAHSLRMEVAAEGVETLEQLNFLADNGCDMFQGYWLAKPMCVKDLEHWLVNDKRLSQDSVLNSQPLNASTL